MAPAVDTKSDLLPDFASGGPICARYAEALGKNRELQARRSDISREVAAIVARYPKGFGLAAEMVAPAPAKAETPVDKLLGVFAPQKPAPKKSAIDADILTARDLSREGEQLDEAMRVLGDQLSALHRKASREYCENIVDQYRPLAARVAQAILDLGEAIDAHDAFIHEVQRREIQSSYLLIVERPRWQQIMRWLKSAIEGGHFDARKIPEKWRSRA